MTISDNITLSHSVLRPGLCGLQAEQALGTPQIISVRCVRNKSASQNARVNPPFHALGFKRCELSGGKSTGR